MNTTGRDAVSPQTEPQARDPRVMVARDPATGAILGEVGATAPIRSRTWSREWHACSRCGRCCGCATVPAT